MMARKPHDSSRRRLFQVAGAAGILALVNRVGGLANAAPPKETGLSFEGLLKGQPGFQPRKIAPPIHNELPGFLSQRQLALNYAAYRDAFTQLLTCEKALTDAPRDAARARDYAALRRRQIEAGNSVLLHEFYFRNLSAAAVTPSAYIIANVNEHMGSLDDWRSDFAACAHVAETWAALVYDPYDDRWHNEALGDSDAGGWSGANPLVVCDVAEHAWSPDYKDRDSYVAQFLAHLDWKTVAARYHAVDRH